MSKFADIVKKLLTISAYLVVFVEILQFAYEKLSPLIEQNKTKE